MNGATQLERRASSRLGKQEGESSLGLCDRLNRTRVNSQRQLPTDHDYAVPTREYQTDQSSLKPAQTAARSVLVKNQQQMQRQLHRIRGVDRVTPYQAKSLIDLFKRMNDFSSWVYNRQLRAAKLTAKEKARCMLIAELSVIFLRRRTESIVTSSRPSAPKPAPV